MINEFNLTDKIWCGPRCEINLPKVGIGHLILQKLQNTDSNRVLEVEHESGATLTAGQIYTQTITVAQNLMRLGVQREDIVIVYSKSNIKITPITFALYTIGAPVNFFYLDLKGDEIEYYFDKLNPSVILYEEEFKSDVVQALEKIHLPNLKHILSIDSPTESVDQILFQPLPGGRTTFDPPEIRNPEELVAVLPFTSGSTGMPKIVMQSHAQLLHSVYNKWWGMDSNSVVCVLSDLRWMDQIGLMLQEVFYGVKRIYTSKCEKNFDDTYEFELLQRNKVTHFFTIPILILRTLRNAVASNTISKLEHLTTLLIGGEAVTDCLVKYMAEVMPKCKVISSYGMTELDVKLASDEEVCGKMVNGGILAEGYSAKIVDENNRLLGPNEKGRLWLKPKIPALGYFKNPDANKEHFKDDGWFRTEEYAFMDADNLLNVIVRFKYLIRFKRSYVDPTAIENIINSHPEVQISALVGHSDIECCDSDIGTLFVVIGKAVHLENIENLLITQLKNYMTKHKLHGLVKYVTVVDKMPLLNYCKINRIVLAEMASKNCVGYSSL